MKTYGELKVAIADYLNREDLAGQLADFIRLAETKFYRALRTRENEFSVVLTGADDPFSPITLPQNFREIRLVTINDVPCEHISDQEFRTRQSMGPGDEITDNYYFTLIERELYLYPWPTETRVGDEWGDATVRIDYYGTESISDMAEWNTPTNPNQIPEDDGTKPTSMYRGGTATTRLFQIAPDLYLYGSIAEALRYLKKYDEAAQYDALTRQMLAELQQEDALSRFTGSTTAVSSTHYDGLRP